MGRKNGNTSRLTKKRRQKGDIRIVKVGKFTFSVHKKYPKTLISKINRLSRNDKISLYRLAGNLGYTHIKKGKYIERLEQFCGILDLNKSAA